MTGAGSPSPPRSRERTMIIKSLAIAMLALTTLGSALQPAAETAAEPGGGASWQVQPSELDGESRATFEASLDPGASSEDRVVITNLGTEPLSLTLSAADIVTTPSGDVTLSADDAEPVASGWVTLSTDEVTLDPSTAVEVPFSVAPPTNAEPGDYAVAIVASLALPVSDTDGQQVVLDTRVGARLYLRVVGDLRSELEVSDLTVERDAGWWNPLPASTSTDFLVTNTGTVRLDASAVVTLTGPFGWELGRSSARELPQLLPGDSVLLSEATSAAASGPAVIAGIVAPFLLTATVEIDATEVSTGQAFVYTASTSTVDVPWLAIVLVVLLLAGVVTRTRVRRRRRRTVRQAEASTPAPAQVAPTA